MPAIFFWWINQQEYALRNLLTYAHLIFHNEKINMDAYDYASTFYNWSGSINNKKIVVLEMLGIVLADEIIAIEEEDILNKMIVKLNLDSDFLEKSKKTVLNLKNAYKDLNELFL